MMACIRENAQPPCGNPASAVRVGPARRLHHAIDRHLVEYDDIAHCKTPFDSSDHLSLTKRTAWGEIDTSVGLP